MGKFDGILFLSDFDNTILYTAEAMKNDGTAPEMPQRNLDAIHYFMEEGGRFGVATGRAMAAFRQYDSIVPTNAPAVVNNGGGVYDYQRGEYVDTLFLGESARPHISAVMEANPAVSLELFHPGDLLQVYHETKWNEKHSQLTGMGYEVVTDLSPEHVEMPLSKALFLGEEEDLKKAAAFIDAQSWRGDYELIFSSTYLLELTAKGANKGNMARRLMAQLGCHTLVCAGDHMNDLSMLTAADRAFCPSNAVPEVKKYATEVGHCKDGAIADMIEHLEKELMA